MKLRVSAWNLVQASIIIVTFLFPFLIQNNLKAQVNICDRTDQVEAEILRLINLPQSVSGVTCDTVTTDQLATRITSLILRDPTPDDGPDETDDDITELKAEDFANLLNLTILDLSNNNLTDLPPGIFSDLTNLTRLELAGNELTTLGSGLFSDLTNLTTLGLNSNGLTSSTSSLLPANLFSGLTSLQHLFLNNNTLETLPENIFDGLTSLTRLDLQDNDLRILSPKIFGLINPMNSRSALTTLNLRNNNLAELPPEIFSGFNNLIGVDVSGNPQDDSPAFTLTVTPVVTDEPDATGQGMAVIEVVQGVPFNVRATVSITGGNFPDGTSTVTIERGKTQSDPFPYTLDLNQTSTTITVSSPTPLNTDNTPIANIESDYGFDAAFNLIGYSGFRLAASGESLILGEFCRRTQQVRAAILRMIGGGVTCLTVTADQLTPITELNLSNRLIRSLKSGDFSGLTSLTRLDLFFNSLRSLPENIFADLTNLRSLDLAFNNLSSLPAGLFNGLTNLVGVDVSDNPERNDSLPLTATLKMISDGTAVVEIALGVPFTNVTVNLEISGGTFSNGMTTMDDVEIVKGETQSAAFEYTVITTAPTPDTPIPETTIRITNITSDPTEIDNEFSISTGMGYGGFELASGDPLIITNGICSRTQQVRAAILVAITETNDCAMVTADQLTEITGMLRLGSENIDSLQSGDFAGLTGLETLFLNNNSLTELPTDIFNGLTALTWLNLDNNSLNMLDEDIFDGLTALTILSLNGNGLSTLDEDIFDGLMNLQRLFLSFNELSELDEDIFDGLMNLQRLFLNTNELKQLPTGIFSGLINPNLDPPSSPLTTLILRSNQLTELPDGIFSGLTSLTTVDVSDNPKPDDPNTDPPPPPFILTATPVVTIDSSDSDPGMAVIEIAQGVPFTTVTATVTITGGEFLDGTPSVTIPKGRTQSDPFPFILTELSGIITVSSPVSVPSDIRDGTQGYSGFQLISGPALTVQARRNICSRTKAVQDEILSLITMNGVSGVRCETVIATQLTEITALNLNSKSISSLKSGDFAGLTGLTSLDLSDNLLMELPDGIFSDLGMLQGMDASGNPGALFILTVTPKMTSPSTAVIEVAQGVPFTSVTATLSITGGSLSGNPTVTIPKGATQSPEFTYTVDPNAISTVLTVSTISDPSNDDIRGGFSSGVGYSGFQLVGEPLLIFGRGICNRTPQVQAAILDEIDSLTRDDCAMVTPALLAEIEILTFLSGQTIASLQSGDFAGLSRLTTLVLEKTTA